MTNEQIKEMVLEIVGEVDYSTWHGITSKTVEVPSELEDNIAVLVRIVRKHLLQSTEPYNWRQPL